MALIDLRSDTVTRPSKEMLTFMMQSKVGDDVFGDDPTVKKLEATIAEMSGKETALFMPSGTQSNLVALMSHCQRGDEYIVGQSAHTYMWEGGGAAVLGSIQPQPIDCESDGSLSLEKIERVIKPIDIHHAHSKLLCLENTNNGKVLPLSYLKKIRPFCIEKKLSSHLDGARAFNAAIKLNVPLSEISQHFNSISICLSKGLGAPVGSLLCGSKSFIQEARRWRKTLGGGMRQVGIIAAAGIYALENNVTRLAHDHENAQILAKGLSEIQEIEIDVASVQTNILFFTIKKQAAELREHLLKKNIIILPQFKSGLSRFVTHLDISKDDCDIVIREIKSFYSK